MGQVPTFEERANPSGQSYTHKGILINLIHFIVEWGGGGWVTLFTLQLCEWTFGKNK